MDWKSTLNLIEKLAPTIAAAAGGPLVGGAVSVLESVFGLTPKADATTTDRQQSLAVAIAGATPDQLLAMKKADQDYAVQMAELGFKNKEALAALVVQDTASAREMQKATKSSMPILLGIFVTVGFFGMLAALLFAAIPKENQPLIFSMTGVLGTAWIAVIHFNFGGTANTEQANTLLAASIPPDVK